jgi:hypothetical protein
LRAVRNVGRLFRRLATAGSSPRSCLRSLPGRWPHRLRPPPSTAALNVYVGDTGRISAQFDGSPTTLFSRPAALTATPA